MDAWVEPFEQAEVWAADEGTAWSTADGALHVTGAPDTPARVRRPLPSFVAGFVRVELRYRATADGEVALVAGTEQTCVTTAAEAWTAHTCFLHVPAMRDEAALTVAVTGGTIDVDEIRIVPLTVGPSVDLPAPVGPLPSALDTLTPGERRVDELDLAGLANDAHRNLVLSRLFARPLIGLTVAQGAAARLGGSVGHRWWTAAVVPIQAGGETALRLSAPVGAARGYRLDLWSSHGPWLGPVGLRVGPALRLDREVWDEVLPTALSVGGTADLGLDVGPLAVSGGVMPLWPVAGDREGLDLTIRGGVRVALSDVDLGVEVAHRSTAIGPIVDGTFSLGLRLP